MSALEEFFGDGNTIKPVEVPIELQSVIDTWLTAISQGRIGFLPRGFEGRVYWYGFAPSARGRRELLELLDGWIGPTYSDLATNRGDLDAHDPFDGPLSRLPTPPVRLEVLPRTPPGSAYSRMEVRAALQVLSRMVGSRPPSEFDAPRTTVEVLDDLGHAIGAQDRRIALECLRELEATADLDQTNLAFLRFRVHAGLEDWTAIFSDQDLEHVLQMRRPLGITRLLQRAVYERFLSAPDLSGSPEALREAAEQIPPPLRTLTTGAVTRTRPTAVVEFLLALINQAPSSTLHRLLAEASEIAPELENVFRPLVPDTKSVQAPEPTPTPAEAKPPPLPHSPDARFHELIDAGELAAAIEAGLALEPELHRAGLLLACVRELEEADLATLVAAHTSTLRQELASDPVALSDLTWLEEFLTPQRNIGWSGWLDAIEMDGLSDLAQVDIGSAADWHTLDRPTASSRLLGMTDEALALFGEHGGAFMGAHREMFVESGGAELCERVLAGLALSGKNSVGIRVQTLALLEYLAEASASGGLLASALEWSGMIVDVALSAVTANWAVDILQAATSTPPAIALDAKNQLFYRTLDLLRPVRSALGLTDLEGLRVVAEELGTELPEDFALASAEHDPVAPYRHLQNQVVVLYSLTESATTRSAQVLRRLLPGIDVRTSAEHGGTPQLGALSANADVFVIVTASAKHAATEFIEEHRGGKPILYVNSRGSSAILRQLAEG